MGRYFFRGYRSQISNKNHLSAECLIVHRSKFIYLSIGSRRQINHKFRGNESAKKNRALFGVEDIPHGYTLNYNYQHMKVEEVQEVNCRVMEKLMEEQELKKWW